MTERLIVLDGYVFVNVTDIADKLWDSDIELYELDDEGVEHLIQDAKHFERALQTSIIVIEGNHLNELK